MVGRLIALIAVAGMIVIGLPGLAKKRQPPPVKAAPKVMNLGEMEIEGKIWKPYVMDFSSARLNFKYKGIPLKGDFIKKATEPTDKNEF